MPYKLTRITDGKPVTLGDTKVAFHGIEYTVVHATPPHRAGSAGKVFIAIDLHDNGRELYATAVGLQWLWIEEQREQGSSVLTSKF
jgi:hypothetical protein